MSASIRRASRLSWLWAGALLGAGAGIAQEQGAGKAGPPVAAGDTVVLRADTLIPLRMRDTVDSATATGGAEFALVVTDDILVNERVVVPAGSVARGEVIHAAKAGMFGKAGELSITSRYVEVGSRRIRLRSLLSAAGANKADLAAGVGLVVPFAPLFIRGRDLVVPADTELVARVAADESFTFDVVEIANPGSIP